MIFNFLSSLILCSYVNCKSSYVGGNKVTYITGPTQTSCMYLDSFVSDY